jgi:hypothetical protein
MTRKVTIAVVICAVALIAFLASNPLRRSESSVRHWLEKTTPLGSSLADVQATATKRGWYHARSQGSDGHTTGAYLRGELGDYQGFPFRTSVTVFWDFDASNRLADIRVWKTTDGL